MVNTQRYNPVEYDYLLKVLLIGDSGVGKSSILEQYADGSFTQASIPTIGVDFKVRTLKIDDKVVKAQVWDTAGQDRFRTITQQYYRNADACIVTFDVTNMESFQNIPYWLQELDRYGPPNVSVMLVGNKCDLVNHRVVSSETMKEFAASVNMEYCETSAKDRGEIEHLFDAVLRKGLKERIENNKMRGKHGPNVVSMNKRPVSPPCRRCWFW